MEKAEGRDVLVVYVAYTTMLVLEMVGQVCIQQQVKSDDRLMDSLIIVPGDKYNLIQQSLLQV